MTTAAALARVLHDPLRVSTFPPDDPNGLWRGEEDRPIRRLGLMLEPPENLAGQIAALELDAVWLHRPWKVAGVPEDFPVLAHHLSFDEALTPGFSAVLARHFSLSDVVPFGEKDKRVLGMIGRVERAPLAAWVSRIARAFGGYEAFEAPRHDAALVERVAFVGAFWPALVEEANEQGVDLYVTGQLRKPGLAALHGLDMAALALGHARCERWGLERLADLIAQADPSLEIIRLGEADAAKG